MLLQDYQVVIFPQTPINLLMVVWSIKGSYFFAIDWIVEKNILMVLSKIEKVVVHLSWLKPEVIINYENIKKPSEKFFEMPR